MASVRPCPMYGTSATSIIVVEAVVENPKVKSRARRSGRGAVKEDAIIASNTSTISISLLAQALRSVRKTSAACISSNPVHMMPLGGSDPWREDR